MCACVFWCWCWGRGDDIMAECLGAEDEASVGLDEGARGLVARGWLVPRILRSHHGLRSNTGPSEPARARVFVCVYVCVFLCVYVCVCPRAGYALIYTSYAFVVCHCFHTHTYTQTKPPIHPPTQNIHTPSRGHSCLPRRPMRWPPLCMCVYVYM